MAILSFGIAMMILANYFSFLLLDNFYQRLFVAFMFLFGIFFSYMMKKIFEYAKLNINKR